MYDKLTISNLALAKKLLGEDSKSFQIIKKEPELFEIMFPGVLEYVNDTNEKTRREFVEALSIMSENLDKEKIESEFTNFIYPVRVMKDKLKIN